MSKSIRQTIDTLNSIKDISSTVNPSLVTMESRISKINDVFTQVSRVTSLVDTCIGALTTLNMCATALSSMPLVGSFMSVLSKSIASVKDCAKAFKPELKEIDAILKKLKSASNTAKNDIEKIEELNSTLQIYIPRIVNTLNVFDYTIQIVDIISPMVKGSELGDTATEIKNKINVIEDGISAPAECVNDIIKALSDVLSEVEHKCQVVIDKTESVRSVISNLSSIGDVITPISNAINKILDRIAPLRWVLDKASCLINKVLNPVIQLILDKTGLSKLIEKFETAILKKLGITSFITQMTSAITGGLTEKLEELVQYDKIKGQFTALTTSMGEFSPVNNMDLKEVFRTLVNQVADAQFDPTKPYHIPDWPTYDTLYLTSFNSVERIVSRSPRINWSDRYMHNSTSSYFISDSQKTKVYNRLRNISSEAEVASQIAQQADLIIANMQKVYAARVTAEANLALLEQSVTLPSYFTNEVDAIKIYFDFISKSTQFVEDTITLTDSQREILSYISKFVETEITTCNKLKSDVINLQSEVASFENFTVGVFNNIPSTEIISEFVYRIQEYSYQAYKLLKSFDLANDHSFSDEDRKKLLDVKGNIVKNANKLIEDLRKIVVATNQLSEKCYDYNVELEQHLIEYEKLSPLGYLFPETEVDNMSKLAATLQQLEGVYEPLELLIDALRSKNNKLEGEDGFNIDVVSEARTLLLAYTNHFEDQKGKILLSIYNLFVDLSPINIVDDNVIGFIEDLKQFETESFDSIIGLTDNVQEFISGGFECAGAVNKFITAEDAAIIEKLCINLTYIKPAKN